MTDVYARFLVELRDDLIAKGYPDEITVTLLEIANWIEELQYE